MSPETEARIARASGSPSRLGPAHAAPSARSRRRGSLFPGAPPSIACSGPSRPGRSAETKTQAGGLSPLGTHPLHGTLADGHHGRGEARRAGAELKMITGLDDHSRFCVSALLVPRATARPVCEALALAMRRHGVPDQILTDNGKVFTARFGPGKGQVLFDRICRENGIKHLLTAPQLAHHHRQGGALPQDGESGVPRGARLRLASRRPRRSWTPGSRSYNEERPHQGIGMVPPAQALRPGRSGLVHSGHPRSARRRRSQRRS